MVDMADLCLTVPTMLEAYNRQRLGIPIGKLAELNIHNNHVQYIFTW